MKFTTKMEANFDSERFLKYHKIDYSTALSEIRNGRKTSHWIWFIFPQLKGLGHSAFAEYFGLEGLKDATAFYGNDTLRKHLREITEALLCLNEANISNVMSDIDVLKLRSSMTLFDIVSPDDIFGKVLDKYYDGVRDNLTLEMISYSSK